MTKKDLVATLATQSEDIETKAAAARIVDTLFNVITDTLAAGNFVDISGFGKFSTREQPGRTGLIPGTKKKYTTSAKNVPVLKFSSKTKEAVKAGK
jgi:DNA-binding protein HU-beta